MIVDEVELRFDEGDFGATPAIPVGDSFMVAFSYPLGHEPGWQVRLPVNPVAVLAAEGRSVRQSLPNDLVFKLGYRFFLFRALEPGTASIGFVTAGTDVAAPRSGTIHFHITDDRDDGITALMLAAGRGDLPAMRRLLAGGSDVDRSARGYGPPLAWAILGQEREAVRLLLEHGARANARKERRGETLLMLSVTSGDVQIAGQLLDAGASIGARDRNGMQALMSGAAAGRMEMVEYLLSRGAAIDATEKTGRTAALLAAAASEWPTVFLLLDAGADLYAMDRYDLSIAYFALYRPRVLRKLLDRGMDVNGFTGKDGTTLLMQSVQVGRPESVRLLLAAGAEREAVNRQGETALDIAKRYANEEIRAMLAGSAAVGEE